MKPLFFKSAEDFRAWLQKNHAAKSELWLGLYKRAAGKPSVSYKEALDEALCFGWIDGVRKRWDDESYVQRFTPRQPKSYWSAVNTDRAKELIKAKRMAPAGLRAFEARDASETRRYSFEREAAAFDAAQLKLFKKNRGAWTFFESQPPYYRKLCTLWVVSAKKEDTRARRLEKLVTDSAAGRRIDFLKPRSTETT